MRESNSYSERLLHVPHHALPPTLIRNPRAAGNPKPVPAWASLITPAPHVKRDIDATLATLDDARLEHALLASLATPGLPPEGRWRPSPTHADIVASV